MRRIITCFFNLGQSGCLMASVHPVERALARTQRGEPKPSALRPRRAPSRLCGRCCIPAESLLLLAPLPCLRPSGPKARKRQASDSSRRKRPAQKRRSLPPLRPSCAPEDPAASPATGFPTVPKRAEASALPSACLECGIGALENPCLAQKP